MFIKIFFVYSSIKEEKMKTIWNFISGFIVIWLTYVFLRWYIKGHFGKYAIFFWIYTIFSIIMFINRPDHNPNWPQRDNRTGAELWEQQYGK
jgi:hypothetical protein